MLKHLKIYIYILPVLVLLSLNQIDKQPQLKNGIYLSAITRPDGKDIVFNFEAKDSAGKKIIYVLNAGEKLLVDSITVNEDSVFIQMPFFESGFRAEMDHQGNLHGQWVKKYGDRVLILPFKATHNHKQRFAVNAKPRYNASGKWDVSFTGKDNEINKAIGEFEQTGSKLTGTFLTGTGDYRYLEGVVSGDSLMLSAFDGGNAYLFTGKLDYGHKISNGYFYSGEKGLMKWEAKKTDKVELPDGYAQTTLREGETKLNFRFVNLDGNEVSINDEQFKNKAVIVQIMGSWCSNCMDETAFLSDYYNRNRQKGLEIIALAYERTSDFEKPKSSLQRFQKRLNVNYPILVTGATVSDPQRTEKTIPQITQIKAFPTTIFIDKKGNVRKIYSGFNGPGTGEHYIKFQKEFEETISSLLKE